MTDDLAPPVKLIIEKREFLRVHYLASIGITIGVKNLHSKATIMVESFALRFQSKRRPIALKDNADPYTTVVYTGDPIVVPPGGLGYATIEVRPNLVFLRYTNTFDVAVTYRLQAERLGRQRSFIDEGWFVIVNPAPQLFGRIFISYKEPEDRRFADLLFELTKDAGFDPYMAPSDVKPGSRIWGKKIPDAIKDSKFLFVILTRNTQKGSGVKRKIRIARQNGIAIVPLLENKTSATGFFGSDVEYTRFGEDNAILVFDKVVRIARE